MISIEVNDDAVQQALNRILESADNLTPFFQDVGEYMIHSTKERFGKGEAPDGTKWQANSELTLSRKKGNDPLIGETKGLSNDIAYALLNDSMMIGSNKEYAAVQQFGAKQHEFGKAPWGDIPARPFLGISDADRDAITELASLHLIGK